MKANKQQKETYKNITKSKFPKEIGKFGEYIPNYTKHADDYVAFISFEKKNMILTISHRMGSDTTYYINKKGQANGTIW